MALERDNGEKEGGVGEKVKAEGQAQFPRRENTAGSPKNVGPGVGGRPDVCTSRAAPGSKQSTPPRET